MPRHEPLALLLLPRLLLHSGLRIGSCLQLNAAHGPGVPLAIQGAQRARATAVGVLRVPLLHLPARHVGGRCAAVGRGAGAQLLPLRLSSVWESTASVLAPPVVLRLALFCSMHPVQSINGCPQGHPHSETYVGGPSQAADQVHVEEDAQGWGEGEERHSEALRHVPHRQQLQAQRDGGKQGQEQGERAPGCPEGEAQAEACGRRAEEGERAPGEGSALSCRRT